MTSPHRADYDQFDFMNPPGEPEPEEVGAVATGGSQNTDLSTWDVFGESTEGSKRDKDRKGKFETFRKGFKKRFASDSNKRDEKHADEHGEQASGAVQNVPQESTNPKGKHKLSRDVKDHQKGSKRESTSDNPELARKLCESEQYKENLRVKASRVEKVKEGLQEDYKKLQEVWANEQIAFQKTSQELEAGFMQLKQKLESSTSEVQRLSQTNEDLKKKESEVRKKFEVQVSGLKTNNQLFQENLAKSEISLKQAKEELTEAKEELMETKKSLDQVKSDIELQEMKLKSTEEMNDSLKQKEVGFSHTIDTLKADVANMSERMQEKEEELKKIQAELKVRTEEVLSFSKARYDILEKFHNAMDKEKSLEKEKNELEKKNLFLTEKIEQMAKVEQTVQEQHQDHIALQETAKQWEYKLEESKSKLEEERKHFTELQHMLDVKDLELQRIKHEHKEKKKESEILQARTQHLENQLEQFKREYQSLSQKIEQERSKAASKHREEMQILMVKNAELKQQLRESLAIYEASKQALPHDTMKIDDSISVPEQSPSEVAQELQLLKPADTKSSEHLRKQKSVELLTESSMQASPNISMHSSAPGSLTKETPGEFKTNQEVTGLYSKSEDEYAQPYESTHTSLTEVVHSVTVTEDNMTDAVKLNIQQEVAALQQIVQSLQEENEKLQSELEALRSERDKLNKIKEKYFFLVSERADIFQKLNETESQSRGSDSMTAPLETSLREEHVDLKKATETLNSRFTSVRKELTRVQSQNSDVSMENDGLMRDIARLEEEKLQLQSAIAKYRKKAEYWQEKSENEGVECRNAAQTAELTISMLQIDLNEFKKKLSRKEDEVQTVNNCRKKLEEQLRINKQERDRQDEHIAQLVAIKADLTHALSRYDSYAQDLGEFKQKSQQFQKALSMKISEVSHLREEKLALQEEIQAMKDELDIRRAEIYSIQEDFAEERKDRARMAFEMDDLKAKLIGQVADIEEECNKEKLLKEFAEAEFHKARETWNTMKLQYERDKKHLEKVRQQKENDIALLTEQVEGLQTKIYEQELYIDQHKKEVNVKLLVAENRLQKEKQEHLSLQEKYEHNLALMQSSNQDFNKRLADSNALNDELKANLDDVSAKNLSIEDELQKMKEEIERQHSQHEAERSAVDKKLKKLREYGENMQENAGILQCQKKLLEEQIAKMEAHFAAEKQSLVSVQQDLKMNLEKTKQNLEETKQHYVREKQQWTKQVQSLDVLRRALNSQLEDEKQRADEDSDTISKLSRDISTKDQMISQYEEQLQFAQENLERHKSDSLKNYEIKEVHCIKSKINAGSYGSISLVNVNGMLCIQKCLHDILVGLNGTEAVSEDQQRSISEKFYEECRLLWKMRHPNIVQFMGIHYNGEVGEIHKMSLIMEYLPSNVEDCITKCSQTNYSIPWSIKISVLRDVTYGLSHLHANGIIHRDLSAANILLTYSMGAKIADLGVSKLVSSSTNTKLTAAPGANYIMPPEALEENPHYSSKLDIFSLGIFILYLISQKEPVPRNATLNSEHVQNKQIEIGRRLSHIHLLRSKNPELVRVVVQALQDEPDSRPTAANLCIPINSCFQKVKHQFYHDLTVFINSVGKNILVFPDC